MVDIKSNTVHDLYKWFRDGLGDPPEPREHTVIANEVFFRFFGLTPDRRIGNPGQRLQESDIILLKKTQQRLNKGEPIQYVTGICDFLDHSIYVQPGILIPRQETEGLALWVIQEIAESSREDMRKLRILDIGTGSGCIAIALARRLNDYEMKACDISEIILQVAKYNAMINNVYIDFFICDVLSAESNKVINTSLDCVVSNPPYVRESEKEGMAGNVLGHEPLSALFVPDDDPMLYYRGISNLSMQWLRPGGRLYFEINEAMGKECIDLVRSQGFENVAVKEDIHGKDRYLRAFKPL